MPFDAGQAKAALSGPGLMPAFRAKPLVADRPLAARSSQRKFFQPSKTAKMTAEI
jgi:hypothetical protein